VELCSDKHEEVCFEGKTCPVCEMRDDMQRSIDDLEKKNVNLKDEVTELENTTPIES